MAQPQMGTSLARSNIVIFFISMSLVLLLAAGVYASNRLLTHWLLVRNLELIYSEKSSDIAGLLDYRRDDSGSSLPDTLSGLRLSIAEEPSATLSTGKQEAIRHLLQPENGSSSILEVAVISADRGNIDWTNAPEFLSRQTPVKAEMAALNSQTVNAVPDMSLTGKLGPTALVTFPSVSPTSQGLIALVTVSGIMKNLAPLLWSVSAAIGGLCFASFLFAGILLWMRFRDQLQTTRNIQYLAHHDTLTGLPNRAVFNARLTEALRLAQVKASNIGVMIIDVDKFKEINDTHGHGIGDVFLQIIAERLKSVFANHLVARLSGDEFAVMLTSISDPGRMTRLASDMINATEAPCSIDSKEIKISLSIGLARATDGSWRSSRLLHCADLALYNAKHSGRSTFSWYTPELDSEAQKRKEIEQGLAKALKFGQFKLLYQPQYALRDGSLRGYEALIRWEHPTKGMIRPDQFIPVAEDTGMIEEIGNWVLNQACKEAALWPNQDRTVAINVSPAQFAAGETQNRVAQALQTSGLDPSRLEIEITESLLISNTDAVIDTLQQIREIGVSIAMDDFGTGYSSLSYLSLFPFDKIKIDRAFIQNLGKDASTDAIVTSIVGLGRSLDVTITAEGVETEAQAILLRAAGCDLVQGFMYGKPDLVSVHEANKPTFAVLKPTVALQKQPVSGTPVTEETADDAVYEKLDADETNSLQMEEGRPSSQQDKSVPTPATG